MVLIRLFGRQAEIVGSRAGGDDHALSLDLAARQRRQLERPAAEIDACDIVRHDARAEVHRLLPHQLHQLGSAHAVLEVRGHQTATILGDGRIQVCVHVARGKAGVVLDLGCERKLAERQRAVDAILLGDRALEHERAEVSAGGVNGGGPAGGAAADDDEFFHAGGVGVQGSVE